MVPWRGAIAGGIWQPVKIIATGDAYQGTLIGIGGETIVGAIGFDWFPDFDLSKRHYYGPGDTWWDADMAIVPLGKGRCIVSQLRLVENLDKDSVADKILLNLIEWTTADNQ